MVFHDILRLVLVFVHRSTQSDLTRGYARTLRVTRHETQDCWKDDLSKHFSGLNLRFYCIIP
jgi:hypothetical protein